MKNEKEKTYSICSTKAGFAIAVSEYYYIRKVLLQVGGRTAKPLVQEQLLSGFDVD